MVDRAVWNVAVPIENLDEKERAAKIAGLQGDIVAAERRGRRRDKSGSDRKSH